MGNIAYIGLGSNIENRLENLREAITALSIVKEINVVNSSSIYETDPVGYEEQDQFLNMVIQVETELTPFELIDACLEIEKNLGRKRLFRWGPRNIDLDILLYNHENIETDKLIIPHPRMHERAFVLIPLLEIHPNVSLPEMEQPLQRLLEAIPDRKGVRIWKRKNGEDVFALFEN
ncbi:2-amino-4-hydroxy-6-hydroxymethyldihydropteridine diphosphokinase [Cytobacillus horneckiae]|uniref:2-amino-4-hydroxy-6-hydroxymethyldihydropteridine diphosphokinase n=1 Tax=Cytobacillus horneckiae TaxID=549687 RepID=A0A2N0ZDE5_9BACI|nr:2-amino-4-hydroxy-6-hydroxymethyldihydropteridine diphosphokinase [Cytobacillus horneckiae]NRG47172.1 2-amino-4-hydroxy-6-hydroxymethyldihydropteridine diphosphokinase [Bacillus sp. CRN 9]MCM3181082.1 2-amino-4-hydroxy-6-hydroxymethyldihydropteridine diphosphokinase [Cytobacillus horneckiae]MEC1154565.1 2-amino-4-hydroxy-6-hydroxymethyldihydropteridine diphosphokinase [Cytobacillus horneckiae]MED2939386.1 2-amino-4-hydroxy-6-hydroxymethyldihydropteridine diphosphokinase [Cytobacillus horneck